MNRLKPRRRDWVGVSEASAMLGVSPATLRRWSDEGRLQVFTTPGGHRRFTRAALLRLLPADRPQRPSIGLAGLTPVRIVRSYRRASRGPSMDLPWVLALTDEQRARFRERGHIVVTGLLRFLDAGQPESAKCHLKEASTSAAEYGRVAAEIGLSLRQTVEGFLRFRTIFFRELMQTARRRGFDVGETNDLVELAERGLDELLVATMAGHDVHVVQDGGHDARALLEAADGQTR